MTDNFYSDNLNYLCGLKNNYENARNILISEIKEKSQNLWKVIITDINITFSNEYLSYMYKDMKINNHINNFTVPIINKRNIRRNEILSVINNIRTNKIIKSVKIFSLPNRDGFDCDDIIINSIENDKFELIWDYGSEGAGNTYRYYFSKQNLLSILEKILSEVQ